MSLFSKGYHHLCTSWNLPVWRLLHLFLLSFYWYSWRTCLLLDVCFFFNCIILFVCCCWNYGSFLLFRSQLNKQPLLFIPNQSLILIPNISSPWRYNLTEKGDMNRQEFFKKIAFVCGFPNPRPAWKMSRLEQLCKSEKEAIDFWHLESQPQLALARASQLVAS